MGAKWGQNFLVEKKAVQLSLNALALSAQDSVLEIGPGRGILTRAILPQAGKLIAVEIDPELSAALQTEFAGNTKFQLIAGDFLLQDLGKILDGHRPWKVIGNIPYGITAPILNKVAESQNWDRALFMVQKEVADRITALPGNRDYGILTISIGIRATTRKVFFAPRGWFRPAPKVDSAVIELTRLAQPQVTSQEEPQFFRVVKAAFSQRRKTALNALRSGYPNLSKEQIAQVITDAGLKLTDRAERWSIADFKRLTQTLKQQ